MDYDLGFDPLVIMDWNLFIYLGAMGMEKWEEVTYTLLCILNQDRCQVSSQVLRSSQVMRFGNDLGKTDRLAT